VPFLQGPMESMASKKKTEQNKTKLKESEEVQSKQKVKFKEVSETFLPKNNTRRPEKAKGNSISLGGDYKPLLSKKMLPSTHAQTLTAIA